ncbi:unnamed protein product [Bemisia tabaci]|uniref:Ionotropic receptor n=1 Tax=Bemisia tabaci TaxID=7038 RepID=A0A9P0F6Q2_BEMTA|nr:unnamed protein product [Bemisia tabaci]
MWYDADNSGPFFDFSVNNMHGKSMHLVLDHLTTDEGKFCLSFDLSWYDVLVDVVTYLKNSINCTIEHHYATIRGMTEYNDHENGQKIGADFHISRSMFRHGVAGVSKFDHSISVESRVALIVTPHSSFIPQVLVGFKSFTLVVWIFLLISTFVFFLMQYFFQCSQSRILYRFYTEAQIFTYKSTSPLLTVYSYFICGRPPTLLLGKFFTGKILFLIFSFSALILSTVFLGAMTTLLTNRVRYSEINSLRDLAASDLLIQTEHTLSAREVFTQYGESKELTAKLTSNLAYYEQTVNMYIAHDSSFKEELLNLSRNEEEGSVRAKDIYKNVKAIIEMDAILIEVPSSFIKRNSIKLEIWGPLKSEYHVVAESVVQNPFSFSLYKNMFLNDIFKKKVVQYMESGLVKKIIEQSMAEVPLEMDIIPPQTEEEPRPYNLNDLQPAFITLPLGFLISQSRIFYRFYTEAQILQYESTSSLLTVYSYFICRSPPTLLLGKFFTGKILFLIFSLSALIFSTVFLGGMTTLLTNRVRYSEINSLQDLQASDLLIQTENDNAAREAFTHYGESKALIAKLTNSMHSYDAAIFSYSMDDQHEYISYSMDYETELYNLTNDEGNGSARGKDIMNNMKSVVEMDAVLIGVPSQIIKKNTINLQIWSPLEYEYHVVEEHVVQIPYSFSFLKNMFLNDVFKDTVAQFMESGLVKKIVEESMNGLPIKTVMLAPPDDGEPRLYNFNDLQPAFVSLFIVDEVHLIKKISALSPRETSKNPNMAGSPKESKVLSNFVDYH